MKIKSISKAPNGIGLSPRLQCAPCLLRQAQEAIVLTGAETGTDFIVLRQVLELMAQFDWRLPPPVQAQQVHRLIRQLTGCSDPYATVKNRLNAFADRLYPDWHRRFQAAHPPMEAAVRLAIVGNLLDVGAKTQLDDNAVLAAFQNALTAPLRGSVEELSEAIRNARSILYLADNAGEIVFDRDLLAQIPLGNLAVAVRGYPVLNDATLADAEQAGVSHLCELISNGSDAPGTILKDCSSTFQDRFESADLVISKGQGNYETLAGTDKHIFFLLKIKCDVLSKTIGFPLGSLVLHHQRPAGGSGAPQLRTKTVKTTTRKALVKQLAHSGRKQAVTPPKR